MPSLCSPNDKASPCVCSQIRQIYFCLCACEVESSWIISPKLVFDLFSRELVKILQKKQLHRMAGNYSLHKFYCLVSLLLLTFSLAFKFFSTAYLSGC